MRGLLGPGRMRFLSRGLVFSDLLTALSVLPWLGIIGGLVFCFLEWSKERDSHGEHPLFDWFLRFWKERMK